MSTTQDYLTPHIRLRQDGRFQAYSKYRNADGTWKQKTCLIPARFTSERSRRRYALEWWKELCRTTGMKEQETPNTNASPSSGAFGNQSNEPNQKTKTETFTVVEMIQNMLDDKLTSGVIERSTYSKELTTLCRVKRHPLGSLDIDDVTERDCLDFFRYLLTERHLAINTVRISQLQLKSAYWHFIREHKTSNNPMQFIKLYPKQKAVPNAVTKTESVAFFDAVNKLAPGSRYHAVTWIAFYTGMREAEITALQWGNVHLDERYIMVTQSIGEDDAHREMHKDTYMKMTKNKKRRIIPINDELFDVLNNRLAYQTKERNGKRPNTITFVVGFPDDRYIRPQSISVWWQRFSRNNHLVGNQQRRVTFHDIRHSFATNMLSGGADVNSVASIMGHSNPSTTLDIYASPDLQAITHAMNTAGMFKGYGIQADGSTPPADG